jgi:hypothetical protein
MNRYFLRLDDGALESARPYRTRAAALAAFGHTARELARYGQDIAATVHMAPSRAELAEYPDFCLSLGPRGGVQVDRV